jgi:LuxR family transcriptional activator of conjugal transfer of Ti plasmids
MCEQMHRAFQTFIDRLSSAENATSFSEAMAAIVTALDLSCFAYLALPSQLRKEPLVISTYPANWVAHYVRNHYERLDPVVMQALQNPEPFQWGLEFMPRHLSSAQQELFDEAAEYGIRFGFTIPIHDDRGAVAAVTFATDESRPPFERTIKEHAEVLQLMAMYFHAHARRTLSFDRTVYGALLSPREYECLQWSSRGKSAWEIGKIIGISRRTAAFHLDNARAKLGVRTVRQAVVLLAESKFRR